MSRPGLGGSPNPKGQPPECVDGKPLAGDPLTLLEDHGYPLISIGPPNPKPETRSTDRDSDRLATELFRRYGSVEKGRFRSREHWVADAAAIRQILGWDRVLATIAATGPLQSRPGLLGLTIAALSGAVIGALITVAIATAAPRSAANAIPTDAISSESRALASSAAASGNLSQPSGAPTDDATPGTPGVEPATSTDLAHQAAGGAPTDPPAVAGGAASFVDPAYGPRYLALPVGPGHRVRICAGSGTVPRCIVRVSNDAGPDPAMQRAGRVADLSFADFRTLCRCDPWAVGLIPVSVEDLE